MGFNLFTWWQGQTFGTWLDTLRRGRQMGRDADGNLYYEDRRAAEGAGRRWVIYAGSNDASGVPPEWHLWLHRTRHAAPTEVPLPVKAWERPWRPNPTGTAAAERPKGSLATLGPRQASTGDYRAWSPEGDGPDRSPEGDGPDRSPEGDGPDRSPEGDGLDRSPEGDIVGQSPEDR